MNKGINPKAREREDKFPTFNLVWYSGTCQRPWDTILVGHPLLFFRKLDLEDDLETKIGKDRPLLGSFLCRSLRRHQEGKDSGYVAAKEM